MSDTLTRGRKALQRIHQRNEDAKWTYATVGRLVAGVPTFEVTGRSNFVQTTIRQANGAQTTVPARNDAGVPWALGLPVRMYKEGTTYVIDGIARRSDLAYSSPGQDPAIHVHDDRYFRENEHIAVSAGAADAGKPAKTDANGKLDGSLLDVAEAIEDASAKTTLVNDDLFGVADSAAAFVLKKFSWANALVQLDSEFAAINKGVNGGDAHDHGTTPGFGGGLIGTVGFLDDAVTNAKLAEMAANTVKANNTGSTANPTDVAAATLVGATIHAATLDITPLDADEVPSLDSSASFGLIRTTWTSIKAFLKTYFDTLYVALTGDQTLTGIFSFVGRINLRNPGTTTTLAVIGDGGRGQLVATTHRASAAGSVVIMSSSRGSEATPTVSVSGDRIFEFIGNGYDGDQFVNAVTVQGLVDGAPGDNDMPGRLEFQTTPDGSNTLIVAMIIDSAQNVAIAPTKAPAGVRFHILQPTLGSVVHRLESTATNDNVIQDVPQGRIATTDATPTTLQTIAIPASHACHLEVSVTARRTGGASGTAEDCAAYILRGLYKNVAGTATLVGAVIQTVVGESVAGYDATLVVSGSNVLVQVTGVATTSITWHSTTRHWYLST